MKRLGIRWVHDELTSRLGDADKKKIGLGLNLRETHLFFSQILYYKGCSNESTTESVT